MRKIAPEYIGDYSRIVLDTGIVHRTLWKRNLLPPPPPPRAPARVTRDPDRMPAGTRAIIAYRVMIGFP